MQSPGRTIKHLLFYYLYKTFIPDGFLSYEAFCTSSVANPVSGPNITVLVSLLSDKVTSVYLLIKFSHYHHLMVSTNPRCPKRLPSFPVVCAFLALFCQAVAANTEIINFLSEQQRIVDLPRPVVGNW